MATSRPTGCCRRCCSEAVGSGEEHHSLPNAYCLLPSCAERDRAQAEAGVFPASDDDHHWINQGGKKMSEVSGNYNVSPRSSISGDEIVAVSKSSSESLQEIGKVKELSRHPESCQPVGKPFEQGQEPSCLAGISGLRPSGGIGSGVGDHRHRSGSSAVGERAPICTLGVAGTPMD
jgi:hypothetical protein